MATFVAAPAFSNSSAARSARPGHLVSAAPGAVSQGGNLSNRPARSPQYCFTSPSSKLISGAWCLARVGAGHQPPSSPLLLQPAVVALSTPRCLTLRSSGAPTAQNPGRAEHTPFILHRAAWLLYRCRPLTSNVRPHKMPLESTGFTALRAEYAKPALSERVEIAAEDKLRPLAIVTVSTK